MTAGPTSPKPPFSKKWTSCPELVALLQQRGLIITDMEAAAAFLGHVGYYRFSGYCLAFERKRHQFLPNVTFEQIRAAYEFDRTLRDLTTEALEVVELDLRAAVAERWGQQHGAFGHTQAQRFHHLFQGGNHTQWLDKLHEETERSSEMFIRHFSNTYREFPELPIWVATEIMSFGCLSKMLAGMAKADQKAISARYGLQRGDMVSWTHHLVYVRNLCAHHARLWDRVWSIKPDLPPGKAWERPLLPGNSRLFITLLILRTLLQGCPTLPTFVGEWRARVETLLAKPPAAANAYGLMGLTQNWIQHPNWT